MTTHMKYTLIIPHYNDTARLDRLLKTVPIVRTDVEVIVVDDCTPQQIKLITLKEAWTSVNWLSTPKNSGAGAARNVGLLNATGKYLVFADSDDEFLLGAFDIFDACIKEGDELVYFLSESKQEVDNTDSVRASGFNKICLEYLEKKTPQTLEKIKLEHVVPWAKVYSKIAIDKLNINFSETSVSNDVEFNVLSAIQIEKTRVIPRVVYRVYRRGGSLTADSTAEAFLERMKVAANLAMKLKKLKVSSRPSATGYILKSLSYDLETILKTIYIGVFSDLRLNIFRVFIPRRWFAFFHKQRADKSEKAAADK